MYTNQHPATGWLVAAITINGNTVRGTVVLVLVLGSGFANRDPLGASKNSDLWEGPVHPQAPRASVRLCVLRPGKTESAILAVSRELRAVICEL